MNTEIESGVSLANADMGHRGGDLLRKHEEALRQSSLPTTTLKAPEEEKSGYEEIAPRFSIPSHW